ncbi:TRAP transporter TatT component family protein [Candidatus Neomarinimicrobiota bacterium]
MRIIRLQDRIQVSLLVASFLLIGCAGPGGALRSTTIHTGYAYAFLSFKADRIKNEDLNRARELYAQALTHYTRAWQDGMAELEKRYPGFTVTLAQNPGEAVKMTDKRDVSLLYWTAAALGSAIGLSKDRPDMLIRLPQVGSLAFRVTELDPGFQDGAVYQLLMIYEAARLGMMGGSIALAKHYFQLALTYSQGRSASPYVSYGEYICVQEQDRETFVAMMNRAIAAPGGGMTNRLAKQRAQWLLTQMDTLFI